MKENKKVNKELEVKYNKAKLDEIDNMKIVKYYLKKQSTEKDNQIKLYEEKVFMSINADKFIESKNRRIGT